MNKDCKLVITVEFARGNVAHYVQKSVGTDMEQGRFIVCDNEIMSINSVECFLQKFIHGNLYQLVDYIGNSINWCMEQAEPACLEEYRINKEIFLSEIELYSIYSEVKKITI